MTAPGLLPIERRRALVRAALAHPDGLDALAGLLGTAEEAPAATKGTARGTLDAQALRNALACFDGDLSRLRACAGEGEA